MLRLIVFIYAVATIGALKIRYDGFKVIRVKTSTADQTRLVDNLVNDEKLLLDQWKRAGKIGDEYVISVPPKSYEAVSKILNHNGVHFAVTLEDLQRAVDEEQRTSITRGFALDRYHRYGEIVSFMGDKVMQNLDMPIARFTVGYSYERRPIEGIKFGSDTATRAIWIDGGIHAREWISPATMVFTINKIITLWRQNDPMIRALLSNVQIYILPVLNPDGYEYSHTDERMWRKNRNRGSFCRGVDLNRNWGFHWMETGASSYECSETYAGKKAMSEPETQAVASFILAQKNRLKMYLSFHSFGQYFLTPWGYGRVYPSDYSDLEKVGRDAVNAMRGSDRRGPRYSLGTAARVLYAAAGGSDDWAKGVAGIKYSYTIELPDTGKYGFVLPDRFITTVTDETWPGFVSLFKFILNSNTL